MSGFDPDAYLKAEEEFDPDAFLEEPPKPATPLERLRAASKPQVGTGETFLGRAVNALPLGNTVTNALTALVQRDKGVRARLTPQARAELEAMGGQEVAAPEPAGFLDNYRTVRDTRKERTEAGAEQNPRAAKAGTAAGIVASILAPLPKVSLGGGVGARLGGAALTGAAYGALDGVEHGDADLTRGEVGPALREAVGGAARGAVVGGVAGAAGEGLARAAPALRRLAVRQGKQHLQGGSDMQAVNRNALSDEAVEEVLESGAIRPLATTQATLPRVEALADEQGRVYASIVEDLESRGVQGPEVRRLADGLYARYVEEFGTTSANKAPANVFLEEAENVQRIALPGPRGGPTQPPGVEAPPAVEGPARARLGLMQTERVKQRLQNDARYDKRNPTGKEESLREAASRLRQANEDAIQEAAMVPGASPRIQELNAAFVPVKQRLGRILEAEEAVSRGAAKAEQRASVGLKDVITGSALGGGDAGATLGGTLLLSLMRNRAPSTVASTSWDLARALQLGGAHASMGRAAPSLLEFAPEPEQTQPGAETPLVAALLRALKRRKEATP